MKVSANLTKKWLKDERRKKEVYSAYVYRLVKEGSCTGTPFLAGRSGCRRVLVRLAGLEAARLSTATRRRVITVQEVRAAMSRLQPRRDVRPAA